MHVFKRKDPAKKAFLEGSPPFTCKNYITQIFEFSRVILRIAVSEFTIYLSFFMRLSPHPFCAHKGVEPITLSHLFKRRRRGQAKSEVYYYCTEWPVYLLWESTFTVRIWYTIIEHVIPTLEPYLSYLFF